MAEWVWTVIIKLWGTISTLTYPPFPAKTSSLKYRISKLQPLGAKKIGSRKTKGSSPRSSSTVLTILRKKVDKLRKKRKLKAECKVEQKRKILNRIIECLCPKRRSICCTTLTNIKIMRLLCWRKPSTIEGTPSTGHKCPCRTTRRREIILTVQSTSIKIQSAIITFFPAPELKMPLEMSKSRKIYHLLCLKMKPEIESTRK